MIVDGDLHSFAPVMEDGFEQTFVIGERAALEGIRFGEIADDFGSEAEIGHIDEVLILPSLDSEFVGERDLSDIDLFLFRAFDVRPRAGPSRR